MDGAPFALVKQILAHRSCEVFVNFMYEEINRFIGHPDQVANFNSFFGTEEWKRCAAPPIPARETVPPRSLSAATARRQRARPLFEMSNERDVTDYYLFYATNELLGLKKMKEAMWKAG